jgi:catechol 2,3-dioxygenase-like lactoylglutathione lyase family enzyme
MLCAGDPALHAELAPELSTMTGKLIFVGAEPGRAALLKLVGNSASFAVNAGIADVLTVARAAGVAPAEALELFAHIDPGKQVGYRGPKMARGDFHATFTLAMARKDVRLALETAAADPDPRLAILPAIAARMDDLIEAGHGADDLSALAADVAAAPRPRRRVFASTPVLVVADLDRAIGFYTRVLGYRDPVAWGEPPCFAMLHRDEHDLMLSLTEPVAPVQRSPHSAGWALHLRVADLATEQRALEAAGVKPVSGPSDPTPYGMIELILDDPDGNRICLGQDLERRPEDVGR